MAAVRPLPARNELDDRNVERSRDRGEDDYGRIALPAFDLRQIALRGARGLRELAARHPRLARESRSRRPMAAMNAR